MEDNSSTGVGGGGVKALTRVGRRGEMVQAVMRVMESHGERQIKLCLLAATHLRLCGPVPNRPQTGTGPRPGGWGPLIK